MHEHALAGCRPVPLASYLKALGVLRLVSEQVDRAARGSWNEDAFELCTVLDRPALERFFLFEYRPTPIIAPWNGGSGFYPKDNRVAIAQIVESSTPRFEHYRIAIDAARRILVDLAIDEKVSADEKPRLLEACRGRLPDDVLPWLDAAYLMTADGAKYPPLLGTGGNDGRLDFTNNFMQRLLDLVDAGTGGPTPAARPLLCAALFDDPTDRLTGGAIGQFLPAGAGGANASAGFDGDSRFNPWDFVLMLEGAVSFAVAAVRRLGQDTDGALSYPFTVRASGIGYASAADADEQASRGEMWLPLWHRPATAFEICALFAEGRARVSGRTARNGVDFARAVATLGVDRGIGALQRYGFQVRNGLAYLATPLDRVRVRFEARARLLDQIDGWISSFRRRATGDLAPASARRALHGLEDAIIDLCRRGGSDRMQGVLVALGRCERTMARSLRWTVESRLTPVPALSPEWLIESRDPSIELRLAAALASVYGNFKDRFLPLRGHFEPISTHVMKQRLRVEWDETGDRDVAWIDGDATTALNAVFGRRLVVAQQTGVDGYPDRARMTAALSDVSAFIDRRTDDARLADLLWGCLLIDWPRVDAPLLDPPDGDGPEPPALYGLMKLCFADGIPLVPQVHRLAATGDGTGASRAAARRLRESGLSPAVSLTFQEGEPARRAAAALLIPLDRGALATLRRAVLRRITQPGETTI